MTAEQVHAAFAGCYEMTLESSFIPVTSFFFFFFFFAQKRAVRAQQTHRFVLQVSRTDGEGVATEV